MKISTLKKRTIVCAFITAAIVTAWIIPAFSARTIAAETAASGTTVTGTVTVETKEEAKKLIDAFYAGTEKANPVSMTSYSDGEITSIFSMEGDKICVDDKFTSTVTYLFTENGKKYCLDDGQEAFEDEFMYNAWADSIGGVLDMFVTGVLDSYEGWDNMKVSATKTDRIVNGKRSPQLVYVVNAKQDGEASKVTVTGTADDRNRVTDIVFEVESDSEKGSYEYKFAYDGIKVTVPEHTLSEISAMELGPQKNYPHVQSPFKTFQDLINTLQEDEQLIYIIEEDRLYAVGKKDGKYYQISAPFSKENQDIYEDLDFTEEDYEKKVYELFGKLAAEDCVDFTEAILPQTILDQCVGKTVQDAVLDGYEETGWNIDAEKAVVFLDKDLMEYDAEIKLPEGFDIEKEIEFEDLTGCKIEKFYFAAPEYAALPFK
ncbi:MAG: hypothetical protein Q4F43_09715 [Eubacteriales bacterium]|nr:hypothetical protein [Eubacteriales bacterium]